MTRKRIFDIISIGNKTDAPSRVFDYFIVTVIFLNLAVTFLMTLAGMAERFPVTKIIEAATIVIFTVEYLLRILTADYLYPEYSPAAARGRFVFSFLGLIDLLSILPFFLPVIFPAGAVAFRIFRVFRIFRLFRVNAQYDAFNVIVDVLREKKNQLISSVAMILIFILAASLCMYSLEHEAQPEQFSNAFSAIWWSVSTLLTIGYGDIYPVTIAGRICAIIISFLGVLMVAIPTGIISAGFVEEYTRIRENRDSRKANLPVTDDDGIDRAGYDYLVVGAGLYGSVFARQMADRGYRVLVIDRRDHIAGNIYTEVRKGINVHRYGAHIFHTNNKAVWEYVNRFATFNRYTNSPVANYRGELYSLPFNMYTFNKMWGAVTPEEAREKIRSQVEDFLRSGGKTDPEGKWEPRNLEEQAISLVGTDIYEKLVKYYTEKQWGRPCTDLPAFIIKRLPVRFTYDNNYFNALYQGIPMGGYTKMTEAILDSPKIDVRLNTDYLDPDIRRELDALTDTVVYTGSVDEYFGYRLGALEYRKVRFETEELDIPNYQGNAVVNYTDGDTPYTRIIEHKWFEFGKDGAGNDIPVTVISKEYSETWHVGDEPYYPVNDEKNTALFEEYRKLILEENQIREEKRSHGEQGNPRILFGGRLGEYRYYDMDRVIERALSDAEKE